MPVDILVQYKEHLRSPIVICHAVYCFFNQSIVVRRLQTVRKSEKRRKSIPSMICRNEQPRLVEFKQNFYYAFLAPDQLDLLQCFTVKLSCNESHICIVTSIIYSLNNTYVNF